MAGRFSIISPVQDVDQSSSLVQDTSHNSKPVDNVSIEEASTKSHSSRTNTIRWTDTSSITISEKGPLFNPATLKRTASNTLSKTGTWTFEIIGLLVGAGAVAGIIAVLAYFDGRAIPDWPIDITLSALIALLATIANANLAAPVQSSISQLKWVRFKTGRAPLIDMEVYDEASRGTVGAIKLLTSLRGGVFGSFGAILTILALALGPFSQQVADYRSRTVESPLGASLPRAMNYTASLPGKTSSNGFVPILPMKSAVYSGLFAESGVPNAALNFTCSTGNCTFDPFETLAICYSCSDLSSYMTRYCENGVPADGNVTSCGWQLPNGAGFLNTSADVFSMTSAFGSAYGNMPYSTIMQLTFMGSESQKVAKLLDPWALQCSLSTCIQTLNSSVTNGHLTENITSTTTNHTVVDISDTSSDIPVTITSPTTNETFIMLMGAKLAMESWFSQLFRTGSASRSDAAVNHTISAGNVIVNLTVGVSSGETFFDTDIVTAFYWNYYEYPDGIEALMEDLSISMTVAIRSFSGAVPHPGLGLSWVTFVHVRWAFISVPVIVVFCTAAFLAATAWKTHQSKTKLWKSSALAMLFHGLDADARERIGTGSLNEEKRRAKKVKVQLDESSEAGSMLRV